MKNLNNLTVLIVTYLTKKDILLDCLKSIDKRIKILIIENSKKFKHEKFFLKKFPNVKILCTGSNLGYGNGNNFGLTLIKTQYALILNPDIICDKKFFLNADKLLNKKINFSIIGCQYSFDKIFMPAGYFNEKENKKFKNNFFKTKSKTLTKVDWVTGCSMLINLKKFKGRDLFDKNFFLYFEEFDLCKSTISKGGLVYSAKDLKVHHLGFKGSLGSNKNLRTEANKLRDWHWMWSYFYFYKKNYNYLYALFKVLGKLLRSFFKSIYFIVVFDNDNKNKYLYRFLGLFSALIGKKANYRGNIFN
tara:strand:- start:90 stop:1001 length:912 start_codon:yes stop_codon:yes gene_type:complete